MTKHGLTAANILRTLPDVLRLDEKTFALATIIAEELSRRPADIDLTRIYAQIDELPEAMLDILAHDFKVDWFGYNYPLSVKREQFKASFQVRKKLGTPGAMEIALRNIYPHTEVEEWFEYEGEPYCFRVVLDITSPQVQLSHEDTLRNVNWHRNKRSHLDAIIFRSRGDFELQLTTGYALYALRLCGTYPVRATQGGIEDHNLIVITGADGLSYTIPMTGQLETGTHPDVATQGFVLADDVLLRTSSEGQAYTVPTTGTKPEIAIQGQTKKSGVEVGDAGEGVAYNVRFCGSSPGGLM